MDPSPAANANIFLEINIMFEKENRNTKKKSFPLIFSFLKRRKGAFTHTTTFSKNTYFSNVNSAHTWKIDGLFQTIVVCQILDTLSNKQTHL